MKILDVKQGSEEWLAARAGIVTASELGALLTPTLKPTDSQGRMTYLYTKLAERWQGFPMPSYGGGVMEQGSILEGEALPWYAVRFKAKPKRVGLVLTDCGRFAASPDGLLPEVGLEIKCPQPPNHVKWLLDGRIPPEHLLQCYGGMFATGYKAWDFVSYCRGFPPLVRRLERDEKVMDLILGQVERVTETLDEWTEKLKEANGGKGPSDSETDDIGPF